MNEGGRPALVLTGGVVLIVLIVLTAWLTREGIDVDPMLRLIGEVVTALSAVSAVALQLASRASTAKVERNTGALANAVYEVADALPRPVPRHAADDTVLLQQAAPAPRGS